MTEFGVIRLENVVVGEGWPEDVEDFCSAKNGVCSVEDTGTKNGVRSNPADVESILFAF